MELNKYCGLKSYRTARIGDFGVIIIIGFCARTSTFVSTPAV
jgi:hypothetical protein